MTTSLITTLFFIIVTTLTTYGLILALRPLVKRFTDHITTTTGSRDLTSLWTAIVIILTLITLLKNTPISETSTSFITVNLAELLTETVYVTIVFMVLALALSLTTRLSKKTD